MSADLGRIVQMETAQSVRGLTFPSVQLLASNELVLSYVDGFMPFLRHGQREGLIKADQC